MEKFGFIGYGSMGSMLVNGLLTSEVLASDRVIISNRTISKLEGLDQKWKGIALTSDNRKVARESDVLFVCVKPLDFSAMLQEIKNDLSESTHLVSIAACITIKDIENRFPGAITKVIPSLTSEVREGISLVCHNSRVSDDRKERLENHLGAISSVIRIKETDFEAAADLTSCAPGMIAAIFENFVQAGVRHSEIPSDAARQMVVSTLIGTAKLLAEKGIGFFRDDHQSGDQGRNNRRGGKGFKSPSSRCL